MSQNHKKIKNFSLLPHSKSVVRFLKILIDIRFSTPWCVLSQHTALPIDISLNPSYWSSLLFSSDPLIPLLCLTTVLLDPCPDYRAIWHAIRGWLLPLPISLPPWLSHPPTAGQAHHHWTQHSSLQSQLLPQRQSMPQHLGVSQDFCL